MSVAVVKCGKCKEHISIESSVKRGIQRFCADGCKPVERKKPGKKKKEDVPSWLRSNVRSLDGDRCRMCRGASRLAVDVHHIFYRSEGGPHEQSNLITLCIECHAVVHSDKKRFQKLCLGIVWIRSVYGDKNTTIYDLERKLNENT